SEMLFTKVVLPTPKLPATSSFTDLVTDSGTYSTTRSGRESPETIEYLLQQGDLRQQFGRSGSAEIAAVEQIGHHDLHHGRRHVQVCGQFRDGQGAAATTQTHHPANVWTRTGGARKSTRLNSSHVEK